MNKDTIFRTFPCTEARPSLSLFDRSKPPGGARTRALINLYGSGISAQKRKTRDDLSGLEVASATASRLLALQAPLSVQTPLVLPAKRRVYQQPHPKHAL